MKLGFENKRKTIWAVVLGVMALLAFVYEIAPLFSGSSTPASSAQAAAPLIPRPTSTARPGAKPAAAKKLPRTDSLDPTLRLDLLASSERTQYEGNGRNIFVSQREEVVIPQPVAPGHTDPQAEQHVYQPPAVQAAPPIPLKFYGFASSPGEAKRIFLKNGEDVFVAGEGEIVDRRYKVLRISTTSVEIQDMVYSGPPQTIPLTQG